MYHFIKNPERGPTSKCFRKDGQFVGNELDRGYANLLVDDDGGYTDVVVDDRAHDDVFVNDRRSLVKQIISKSNKRKLDSSN